MVRDDVRVQRREVGEGVVRLLSGDRGNDVGEAGGQERGRRDDNVASLEEGREDAERIGAEDMREADVSTGEQETATGEMRSPEEAPEEVSATAAQTGILPSPPAEADPSGEPKEDSDDEDMEEV